jgi:hypothetical protein
MGQKTKCSEEERNAGFRGFQESLNGENKNCNSNLNTDVVTDHTRRHDLLVTVSRCGS